MKLLDLIKNNKETFDFDVLPDALVIIQQDGKIIDVNSKALEYFGVAKFEVLGKYFSDFVENGTAVLNQICTSGEPKSAYSIAKNKKPSELFEITANRDIQAEKIYVMIRNSTQKDKEQKKINERYALVQNIVDKKNDFIIEASGPILSTLTSVVGFSRALLDGIAGEITEKQKKYLNIINTSSKDLNYDLEKLFSLFKLESRQIEYDCKPFDLMSLIKSIERIYKKDFEDKKIIFNLDYSTLSQRDCYLDAEIVEYIFRCIMDIFQRFATFGKCSLNIGHPPEAFLENRDFEGKISQDCNQYVLCEAKIADLVFSEEELNNIFDMYYKSTTKRPFGLKATFNILKLYIKDFKGDIWIYSKENFGTMITFVLPLK